MLGQPVKMLRQRFVVETYCQEDLLPHMEYLIQETLERDDVLFADVQLMMTTESYVTYPEEADDHPEEYFELTKDEIAQQDHVDNHIFDLLYSLLTDEELERGNIGEAAGAIRDVIVGVYKLDLDKFYPYLKPKGAEQ